ncbi:hypothetical protein Sjap_012632 [Stephania japonica]|uniref:Protein kinase domain-containing protein n=1 Tax=Stephania japonica TaxID=461633 RepID=A0AAP0IXK3_9MAGN
MAKPKRVSLTPFLVLFFVVLSPISCSKQFVNSHTQTAHTLLSIQELLNFPPVLSGWNASTDFCNAENVVCYEGKITQLHIIGDNASPLPRNFSIDSFVTSLVRLPGLKVISLVSLGLWGSLPGNISQLPYLEILNMSSNFLSGVVPREMSVMRNLQTVILDNNMFYGQVPNWVVLALSSNRLSGELPDLSSLTNLQVLDLEGNRFGPRFPILASKLVTLVLSKNKFSSAIPNELNSYYQLERLDISINRFVGPFPASLLSLPSLVRLNISGNRFTGLLTKYMSCNEELGSVDLSSNLLTGDLPSCLLTHSKNRVVHYAGNCLATGDQNQHPYVSCRNEALAVGIMPLKQKRRRRAAKAVLALLITGGILIGMVLVGVAFLLFRRLYFKKFMKRPQTRLIKESASAAYTSKLISDTRYISQTMKSGALGLPSYRAFSLDELEGATNNFHTSSFLGEGSHGQMYRGKLKDGSLVAIRCLKLKKRHTTQNFTHQIELISKLRHHNLVSALGHCFECYLDDSSVSRIFLVFEYVPNGTLRGCISESPAEQALSWTQRIAAAIGVAKGIQYLHTGIVPGVFSNNLKITDILLDQNLVAKISSYNLPLLAENMGQAYTGLASSGSREHGLYVSRREHEDKIDIYDFGVILLELTVGRPIISKNEVDSLRDLLQVDVTEDSARGIVVDPAISNACSEESLKTVMNICSRALSNEPASRPSIEDVLWNLQFAAQVQEEWRTESDSRKSSPSSRPANLPLTHQQYCEESVNAIDNGFANIDFGTYTRRVRKMISLSGKKHRIWNDEEEYRRLQM